jgi:hypothetical protein
MAKPIKDTPTLYGKDTTNFLKEMETDKTISIQEKEEMLSDYKYLESITTNKDIKDDISCLKQIYNEANFFEFHAAVTNFGYTLEELKMYGLEIKESDLDTWK